MEPWRAEKAPPGFFFCWRSPPWLASQVFRLGTFVGLVGPPPRLQPKGPFPIPELRWRSFPPVEAPNFDAQFTDHTPSGLFHKPSYAHQVSQSSENGPVQPAERGPRASAAGLPVFRALPHAASSSFRTNQLMAASHSGTIKQPVALVNTSTIPDT